jgi:hypothetical protein
MMQGVARKFEPAETELLCFAARIVLRFLKEWNDKSGKSYAT